MRKLIALCALFAYAPALAKDVHEIKDADADASVKIINTAGEIEVNGWSRNQVEITGELGSGVKELVFESDGDEVLIKVKVPGFSVRSASADLVINVPEGASVTISAVSADISVDDVKGRQNVESVSGDIEIEVFASDIDIESVSGDIEIEGDGSSIRSRFEVVSSDIDIDSVHGEIEVTSVSGDIAMVNSVYEVAEIQTVNGDIDFGSALDGESRMEIETVNGDVDIDFEGGISARFDIETFNGDIDNCFGPESERTSRYAPGRELKFTEGSGSGRVVIRTLNGDLSLCKD